MKLLQTCLTSALCLCTVAASYAAPRRTSAPRPRISVRAVDTNRDIPTDLIAPSSFETDVHKMMENWYLRNYAVMDKDADKRTTVNASDDVYIERLQSLNTVIEMPYSKEVRAFINMYVDRKKSLVESILGMSLYYMPIFEEALDRYGIPMELKYLPVIESALNPTAVSPAGATGIWQFMPSTATGLGLEVNSVVDERRDPVRSSEAAARYLKQLYNTYGDWSLAIAAYNCGPGNVNKALRRVGSGKHDFWEIYPYLPAETRTYVPAFIAATYVMNFYNKHNISPVLAAKPIVTDSVHVTRRVHFQQISDVLGIPVDEIRALNPQYRTDVIPGNVKPYPLVLPNLQVYCYIANEDSIVNHNADKYARREVVEPSTGQQRNGEYVQELVVKYHKVRRGETLSSIARRYGVSASSISKTNRIGKKVKRGMTLKINTYRRRFIEAPAVSADTTAVMANDSIAPQVPVATDAVKAETVPVEKPAPKKPARQQKQEHKPVTHTIKAGENLSKIADKYGISVNTLKQANNLKSDNIQAGKTLTIPGKNATKYKGKKSSKKSKRRRHR